MAGQTRSVRVSCPKFTVRVAVHAGVIVEAAPMVRTFIGQPLANLERWAKQRFGAVDIDDLGEVGGTRSPGKGAA